QSELLGQPPRSGSLLGQRSARFAGPASHRSSSCWGQPPRSPVAGQPPRSQLLASLPRLPIAGQPARSPVAGPASADLPVAGAGSRRVSVAGPASQILSCWASPPRECQLLAASQIPSCWGKTAKSSPSCAARAEQGAPFKLWHDLRGRQCYLPASPRRPRCPLAPPAISGRGRLNGLAMRAFSWPGRVAFAGRPGRPAGAASSPHQDGCGCRPWCPRSLAETGCPSRLLTRADGRERTSAAGQTALPPWSSGRPNRRPIRQLRDSRGCPARQAVLATLRAVQPFPPHRKALIHMSKSSSDSALRRQQSVGHHRRGCGLAVCGFGGVGQGGRHQADGSRLAPSDEGFWIASAGSLSAAGGAAGASKALPRRLQPVWLLAKHHRWRVFLRVELAQTVWRRDVGSKSGKPGSANWATLVLPQLQHVAANSTTRTADSEKQLSDSFIWPSRCAVLFEKAGQLNLAAKFCFIGQSWQAAKRRNLVHSRCNTLYSHTAPTNESSRAGAARWRSCHSLATRTPGPSPDRGLHHDVPPVTTPGMPRSHSHAEHNSATQGSIGGVVGASRSRNATPLVRQCRYSGRLTWARVGPLDQPHLVVPSSNTFAIMSRSRNFKSPSCSIGAVCWQNSGSVTNRISIGQQSGHVIHGLLSHKRVAVELQKQFGPLLHAGPSVQTQKQLQHRPAVQAGTGPHPQPPDRPPARRRRTPRRASSHRRAAATQTKTPGVHKGAQNERSALAPEKTADVAPAKPAAIVAGAPVGQRGREAGAGAVWRELRDAYRERSCAPLLHQRETDLRRAPVVSREAFGKSPAERLETRQQFAKEMLQGKSPNWPGKLVVRCPQQHSNVTEQPLSAAAASKSCSSFEEAADSASRRRARPTVPGVPFGVVTQRQTPSAGQPPTRAERDSFWRVGESRRSLLRGEKRIGELRLKRPTEGEWRGGYKTNIVRSGWHS
uniref:Protein kinase domain-containing protein n=1 Tax=Macrostomum lignano TaxID=282301 RepID=A0A1I8JRP3_9PLAT